QVLAGDNKFLCAKCNEKRDTLKRTCIARLPNVLFLHLKRFEFDMMEMKKVRQGRHFKKNKLTPLKEYRLRQNTVSEGFCQFLSVRVLYS
ncbi:unnamed protein product, partial [Scytosiphon promiscuus]